MKMNSEESRELLEIFRSYINSIQSYRENNPQAIGPFQPNREEISVIIYRLEQQSEFHQLVETTRSLFSKGYHKPQTWGWKYAVECFFRRSGCYIDIFKDIPINTNEIFNLFCLAFEKQEIQVTYLVPLLYVEFNQNLIDFGIFQIKQFILSEFENRLRIQNRINEVFYPWAMFNLKKMIEIKKLDEYWFLAFTESAPAPTLGVEEPLSQETQDFLEGRQRMVFTNYPKNLESVLQLLTLFNWPDSMPPIGFSIPFIIVEHNNLLDVPRSSPDISKLKLVIDSWNDSMGNEIEKNVPPFHTHISLDEIEALKNFIEDLSKIYTKLNPIIKGENSNWKFVEVALGFFIKAFFTNGLEQFLWYITTLEALLGKKGEVRKSLKDRISAILGKSDSQKQQIQNKIHELYDFRCDLVHGNCELLSNEIYDEHLRRARKYAREILCWFLHFLNKMHDLNECPGRLDLLKIIDGKPHERKYIRLRSNLPKNFPHVPGWIV